MYGHLKITPFFETNTLKHTEASYFKAFKLCNVDTPPPHNILNIIKETHLHAFVVVNF